MIHCLNKVTADKVFAGSCISLSVLIEFIITSNNSIASFLSTPWETPPHILASFTNKLSHLQSLSFLFSLHFGLPWEWVDHTDLIRQPCNDEICTTGPLVPQRTYSKDSRSLLALAWGHCETAGASDFREEQYLILLSVRKADW